jgi:hypothetical protein
MPPERVAAQLLRAVARGRATLVPGVGNRVGAWLGSWLPCLTDRILVRTILERLPDAPATAPHARVGPGRPGALR